MKTLMVAVQKGGVGKTMISCQLARYARELGLRVLAIDLDDQANLTRSLERDQAAQRLPLTVTQVLFQANEGMVPDDSGFTLLAADGNVNAVLVEQARLKVDIDGENTEKSVLAHRNFELFLRAMDPHFDLCVLDGPPTTDVRVTMGLAVASAVLCPFQLAQESIEGLGETLNGRRGVFRIKQQINPSLNFLGFLPNLVESTPKHREALKAVASVVGEFFLRDAGGSILMIPKRESLREAQAIGTLVSNLGRSGSSSARETWSKVQPVLDTLLERLELRQRIDDIAAEARERARLRKLYEANGNDEAVAALESVGGAEEQ